MRGLLLILGLACALAGGPAATRENHALLIGVAEYPNLRERLWLKGPVNDVALVAEYLASNPSMPFDPARITVLAEGYEGSDGPATLANIRARMAGLADRVAPGDFVLLYFSGHGSQAPALTDDEESDGLDELFLPADIGPWEKTTGTIENALTDDEIGRMIAAIRAKGADVWAIFDSCHSGTVTRDGRGDDVRYRSIDPAELGVPATAVAAARPEPPVALGDGAGSLVAFFAAQTNEETPERGLPRTERKRKAYGVFTWTVFEVLAEHPGISYRQLGQEVLRRYVADNRAATTPLFEGDLDRAVLGGERLPRAEQWPVTLGFDALGVRAGSLHGIAAGERLMLLPGPLAEPDEALGEVEAAEIGPLSARLVPVGSTLALEAIPEGAWVRRVNASVPLVLPVAVPPGDSAIGEALSMLAEEGGLRVAVSVPEDAVVRLVTRPGTDRLWLSPSSGEVVAEGPGATSSVPLADDPRALADALRMPLTRIARAHNLLRMGGPFSALDLKVAARLVTGAPDAQVDRDPAEVPRLVPGDGIWIVLENGEDVPVDANVFYVGSDWSISHLYAGRLLPGAVKKKGLVRITAATGRERLLVVLSPVRGRENVENLSFLAQEGVGTVRSEGLSPFAAALAEAGFGRRTRASVPSGDGAVLQLEVETVEAR